MDGVTSTLTCFWQVFFTASGCLTWAKAESWQDTLVFKVGSLQPEGRGHPGAEPERKAKFKGKLEALRVADHDLPGSSPNPLLYSHQRRPCVYVMDKKSPHSCSYHSDSGPLFSPPSLCSSHTFPGLCPPDPAPSLHNPRRHPSHCHFRECWPWSWVTWQLCASRRLYLLSPWPRMLFHNISFSFLRFLLKSHILWEAFPMFYAKLHPPHHSLTACLALVFCISLTSIWLIYCLPTFPTPLEHKLHTGRIFVCSVHCYLPST